MKPKSREDRLRHIRRLIKTNKIASQDELQKILEKDGFLVAQATLSRDLRYLKVGKKPDRSDLYCYTLPSEKEESENERIHITEFENGYVSIDWNASTVVIKTFSGHATTVALSIDNMNFENVLGTIAGQDNVVFIALKDGYTGLDFMNDLRKKIPDLDKEGY